MLNKIVRSKQEEQATQKTHIHKARAHTQPQTQMQTKYKNMNKGDMKKMIVDNIYKF